MNARRDPMHPAATPAMTTRRSVSDVERIIVQYFITDEQRSGRATLSLLQLTSGLVGSGLLTDHEFRYGVQGLVEAQTIFRTANQRFGLTAAKPS